MSTYILGINAYHGDVSAVLLRDGFLVGALEEERFRRIKHYAGFPSLAIQRLLRMENISGGEIDHIAISRDPKANLWRKAGFLLKKRPSLKLILDRAQNAQKVRDFRPPLAQVLDVALEALPTVHYVEHHPAHLASAFFVSAFEEAAVCAIDGMGDFVSTSVAEGKGHQLSVLDRVYFPHSLGILYTAITQYLGFCHYGDEYKVMGLAPYGKPTYVEKLNELITFHPDGTFELNLPYFRHWNEGVAMEWDDGAPTIGQVYTERLEALLGQAARKSDEALTAFHEDVAHSLQHLYEQAAFHVLNALHERTGHRRLCLAGGCGMNSVANGKIRSHTPFEAVYVQPAAADNGTALGAAFYVWNQVLKQPRTFEMEHSSWGTAYQGLGREHIEKHLGNVSEALEVHTFASIEEAIERAADLLADGHVIGWFQGQMEWGARALGNRSILADPTRADMRDLINLKIKFRERFRPFAPSIAEEALDDYFVDAAPDPFMQSVYPVRPEKRGMLPAITHVDGTGRVQTVTSAQNPTYYRLLKAFEARKGIPMLLNTSFNENEPIVETPWQAIDCFLRTKMDAVFVETTLIQRVSDTKS